MVTKRGGDREPSTASVHDDYPGLVRSAAAGDTEALNRLLMRAQETAWRFSMSVCGRSDDAEDAMQEALIKTYRYVDDEEAAAAHEAANLRLVLDHDGGGLGHS